MCVCVCVCVSVCVCLGWRGMRLLERDVSALGYVCANAPGPFLTYISLGRLLPGPRPVPLPSQLHTVLPISSSSSNPQAIMEKEQIEEFMKGGRDLFEQQAASVEDIGKAGRMARQMVDKLTAVVQVCAVWGRCRGKEPTEGACLPYRISTLRSSVASRRRTSCCARWQQVAVRARQLPR